VIRHSRILAVALLILGLAIVLAWAATTTASNTYGDFTVKTGDPNSNNIDIKFKPKATVNCDKIVFIQTSKLTFKNGGDVVMKPGDYFAGWRYMDKNVIANGTFVDNISTEKDPYNNGDDDPEDGGTPGKRNATGSTDSEFDDHPSTNGLWPPGKTRFLVEFETCAICAAGQDAGTTYGCVTWKLEETKGSEPGTVSVTSGTDVKLPSSSFQEAVDKFEENHINERDQRYCPEAP